MGGKFPVNELLHDRDRNTARVGNKCKSNRASNSIPREPGGRRRGITMRSVIPIATGGGGRRTSFLNCCKKTQSFFISDLGRIEDCRSLSPLDICIDCDPHDPNTYPR